MKKVKEQLIFSEKVNIFKIDDSPEYRKALEKGDFEAIKKLSKFSSQKKNVMPISGREMIARTLTRHAESQVHDETGQTWINKCAIGTGSGVHTENDTKLQAEVFRKNLPSASYSGDIFKTTSHYLPEDCSGNFREEGIFIEGGEEKDTGYPLSIISLSAEEGDKSSSEALLIERTFRLTTS